MYIVTNQDIGDYEGELSSSFQHPIAVQHQSQQRAVDEY